MLKPFPWLDLSGLVNPRVPDIRNIVVAVMNDGCSTVTHVSYAHTSLNAEHLQCDYCVACEMTVGFFGSDCHRSWNLTVATTCLAINKADSSRFYLTFLCLPGRTVRTAAATRIRTPSRTRPTRPRRHRRRSRRSSSSSSRRRSARRSSVR